jgi:hypothetical protein
MSQTTTQTQTQNNEKPYVASITIEHIIESNPDLSHLTEHSSGAEYTEQDNERIEAYNRGDWYSMGIGARAFIYIPGIYEKMTFSFELQSMGLWGIESDSDPKYIKEIENQELDCIREQLKRLGIKYPKNIQVNRVDRREE